MLPIYSVSKRLKGEIENRLEELHRETHWLATRTLATALLVMFGRELYLELEKTGANEVKIFVLAGVTGLLLILALASFKSVRKLFRMIVWDYKFWDLHRLTRKNILKAEFELKELGNELDYFKALLAMTGKLKRKHLGILVENQLNECLLMLEKIKDKVQSYRKQKRLTEHVDRLESSYGAILGRFISIIDSMTESGASFSSSFTQRYSQLHI